MRRLDGRQPMNESRADGMKTDSHIAYDARLAMGQYRGMGRFLRLLIAGREQELLGLCATGEQDAALNLFASGYRFYPLWEQVSIPKLVRRYRIDTFLAPYNTAPLRLPRGVKLVMVVYDLIFMEDLPLSRSLYQNVGRLYRRLVVPRAIRRADVVVTLTHYTARLLESRFALDGSRIRVIPYSIGKEWFIAGSEAPDSTVRYVLVVAGEAPSKNLSRAIAAFARCRQLRGDPLLRLKVAGVKDKYHGLFQAEARQQGVAAFVDFLGFIPDPEMRILYRQAALFLMPSLSEGFGIPVLEAMVSGTPVAASSSTCLQEIGGNAARYFDPYSVEEMAATMCTILDNSTLRSEMSKQGHIQSQIFHPNAVLERIRALWSEIEGL
jgi:glycosyltransferase involved in cell wall biosynthesis